MVNIPISGATASTYTLVSGDVDRTVLCRVTGANVAGSAAAVSNTKGPIVDPVTYDSATTAWINAVVAASGTVSPGRRTLVDALIVGLKADSLWAKLDRLWLFAAENTQSALLDLKGTNTATASGVPTFTTDRGYTGASAKYIDTGFIPSSSGVNFTLNSACFFVWNNTSGIVTNALVGSDTANRNKLYPEHATNDTRFSINTISATGSTTSGVTGAAGLWVVNRTASNANQLYRNGSSIATSTNASSSLHTTAIYVFRDATLYSTRQASCFGTGASLDSTEQTNLYNRIRTYMTAVGVP